MAKDEEPPEEERSQEQMLESLIHKALESNRVVIDFDVIALAGLTGSIYALGGPKAAVDTFLGTLGIMGAAFSQILLGGLSGVGETMVGNINWEDLWKFIFPWGPVIP